MTDFPPPPAPPPGYAAGGHPFAPAGQARTNGFAVASFVLGIVGVGLCFIFVPSVLAVIFGAVALSQIKSQPAVYTGRGFAIAGLVLGIVGVALIALVLATSNVDYKFGGKEHAEVADAKFSPTPNAALVFSAASPTRRRAEVRPAAAF